MSINSEKSAEASSNNTDPFCYTNLQALTVGANLHRIESIMHSAQRGTGGIQELDVLSFDAVSAVVKYKHIYKDEV